MLHLCLKGATAKSENAIHLNKLCWQGATQHLAIPLLNNKFKPPYFCLV